MYLLKKEKLIISPKHIKVYKPNVRDFLIRQVIKIFQYSLVVKIVKEDSVVVVVIGAENADNANYSNVSFFLFIS